MNIQQRIEFEASKRISWEDVGKALNKQWLQRHPQLPSTPHFITLGQLSSVINQSHKRGQQ